MRKEILDSRFVHYALLVLSLSAASAGGLILLGCLYPETAKDVTVVDPTQRFDNGGVRFLKSESKTEARVNLSPKWRGEPVKWTVAANHTDIAQIPDSSKSNEAVVLFPSDGWSRDVVFEGKYEKNGRQWAVHTIVHVEVEN